jgi:hypothetical protein
MPYHDVFFIVFASWIRYRQPTRREAYQDMIRETLEALDSLQFHEPVDPVSEQQYWEEFIDERCHLVVLLADLLVDEWMLGWAVAYLAARPMVNYVQ